MAIRDDDETAVSTSASTGGGARRGPRFLNFDAVTTQRVAITARGGRIFELRDDFPAHILLRYQMLPSVEDRSKTLLLRLRRERKGAEESDPEGEDEAAARQIERDLAEKEAMRAALAGFSRELQEDVFDVCGDLFRHTYPDLTNRDLFGTWDERKFSHDGGIFSPQEAQQIVELFISLRGGAFSMQPPATEP